MDAVLAAAASSAPARRLVLAGGVESMSRAPFVMPKADTAFSRNAEIYDTTIGWRFVNPVMKSQYGVDSMPETGENVAEDFGISREDQDAFALRSQTRAGKPRRQSGRLAKEIVAVEIPRRKGDADRRRRRRASAPGHHARTAGQAQGPVPRRRHGDRGQRVRRQ
jgi:acetyl-CoA acyltransferase